MTYRLTIDSNLMDAGLKVAGMDVLKRWKNEGKIDFTEADRPTQKGSTAFSVPPVPQPKVAWRGKARAGKMVSSGNATFSSVAAVLFPFRDSDKLNMSEMNNVIHIINHHLSKNEIFVTTNLTSFIAGGRREKLKLSLGVVTMTPEETVHMLDELEGWLKPKAATKERS